MFNVFVRVCGIEIEMELEPGYPGRLALAFMVDKRTTAVPRVSVTNNIVRRGHHT